MKFLATTFCLVSMLSVFSQASNFNSQGAWSRNKKEIVMSLGATQFLGDLGGRNRIGKDYTMGDLNWKSTNFNIGVGFRYRFHKNFATTSMLNIGMLKGDDALTDEPIRNARNLHFRSPLINLNQRIEWIIWANDKTGSRYGMKGGAKNHNFQLYAFTGIGIAWFNPQARYQGKWVNLRPLKTEGQGMENGPKNYLPITATIPAGLGVKFGIAKMWTLGIGAIYLKTFSDYIDDVSGSYYDPAILADRIGPASAYLSNPSSTPSLFNPGSQRGDKDKDAVFYLNIIATKNITYKNYSSSLKVKRYKYKRSKF